MPRLKILFLLTLATLLALAGAATAQSADGAVVVQAREALRKKDSAQLAALRQAVNRAAHPLAPWVEYWELGNRLASAQQSDLDTFYARWGGTYVEDRLRNDWLLELGRRRDWMNLRAEFARFRMNDDPEVTCYALHAQHIGGLEVRGTARAAWQSQRDPGDGCQLLAQTLRDARQLSDADLWHAARLSIEANRPRGARAAAALLRADLEPAVVELLEDPARYLDRRARTGTLNGIELTLLALVRLSASDPARAVFGRKLG